VYGGDDRIGALTKKVSHNDEFKVWLLLSMQGCRGCDTSPENKLSENEEFVCNILNTTSLVYLDFTPLPC
jgi:hypothetical protein